VDAVGGRSAARRGDVTTPHERLPRPGCAQEAIEDMIARDPVRLAAARLAADYVWRAQAWACDVDEELVTELEHVHQRILDHIQHTLPQPRRPREVA
jgi:hypothetical protein